jgi:hypothetical protein
VAFYACGALTRTNYTPAARRISKNGIVANALAKYADSNARLVKKPNRAENTGCFRSSRIALYNVTEVM